MSRKWMVAASRLTWQMLEVVAEAEAEATAAAVVVEAIAVEVEAITVEVEADMAVEATAVVVVVTVVVTEPTVVGGVAILYDVSRSCPLCVKIRCSLHALQYTS
jgi:hypothetical protein